MLITFADDAGTVYVDLELASIRTFSYDRDVWTRTHDFSTSPESGLITDGTLSSGEVSKLYALAAAVGSRQLRSRPTELHGFGMLRLVLSDKVTISDSIWNENESGDPDIIRCAGYMRALRR